MKIAGIDIGGANLKFALLNSSLLGSDCSSFKSIASEHIEFTDEFLFPFWTSHCDLVSALTRIAKTVGDVDGVAITMTAELADCFENKRHGVRYIVDAVETAFPKTTCRFYTTAGELVEATIAKQNWALTAASNWHASAWFLFRQHNQQAGFLVDIGSTTCDIIPVQAGMPELTGQTDLDRLRSGQLVYAGIGRTAVCSLIDSVQFQDHNIAIAREVFATVADAMIWTNRSSPAPQSRDSADGRPQSRAACRSRLCRMLCADDCDLNDEQVTQIAEQTCDALKKEIMAGLKIVVDHYPSISKTFCLAGSGQTLARYAIQSVFQSQANLKILETADPRTIGQAIPAIAVAARWLATAEDTL